MIKRDSSTYLVATIAIKKLSVFTLVRKLLRGER